MIDMKPAFLCVEEWRKQFSPPPHPATVLRWIKKGIIQPEPKKMGRNWYIAAHATYVVTANKNNNDQKDEPTDSA